MTFHPQLLRLLHLASPALPIGAFHFSQGLEYAVQAQWVRDEESAFTWIEGLSRASLGMLDLPVLARLHAAWSIDDHAALEKWNAMLLAARETEELRAEDRHLGAALARVLVELDIDADRSGFGATDYSYAAMFALACVRWEIETADALQAYGWVWTEGQVLAAVKLVPLGQRAGQRILHRMVPRLAELTQSACAMHDAEIGVATLMHGFASARHETQYTRLFRS